MAGYKTTPWRIIACQALSIAAVWVGLSACMAKPIHVPVQAIPEELPLSPGESQMGRRLYENFNKTYILSDNAEQVAQIERLVDHLAQAAGAGYANWKVHLFDAPEVIDVRATPGNRIFVWSGLLDEIQNEDELAGLLAYEMAHDLARHTDPVRFNIMSNLLFQIGSLAGSTALMIASQGAVNLSGLDWMKLAYIEARDLGPEERHYSETEERQAATIAMMVLERSDCRPEALIEFYWRTLEERPGQGTMTRLHRSLTPQQRLDILESLVAEQEAEQTADVKDHGMDIDDSE